MEEARLRFNREAPTGSLLSKGFNASLGELVDWSALLHDLGKLQAQWQAWAEAAQRARDDSYIHSELLAHTDFDSSNAGDRALIRAVTPRRPHHSAASAYYGFRILERAASHIPLASKAGCIAAVLGHHGGWAEQTVLPMEPRWRSAVAALRTEAARTDLSTPSLAAVDRLLGLGLSSMKLQFAVWWPIAAYLTRTLRLSDQLATEEGNQDG
jgi:hypothetical protein